MARMAFRAIFLGGPSGIFRTLKCTFGVSGFRGSVGGPGDCRHGLQKQFPQHDDFLLSKLLSGSANRRVLSVLDVHDIADSLQISVVMDKSTLAHVLVSEIQSIICFFQVQRRATDKHTHTHTLRD